MKPLFSTSKDTAWVIGKACDLLGECQCCQTGNCFTHAESDPLGALKDGCICSACMEMPQKSGVMHDLKSHLTHKLAHMSGNELRSAVDVCEDPDLRIPYLKIKSSLAETAVREALENIDKVSGWTHA